MNPSNNHYQPGPNLPPPTVETPHEPITEQAKTPKTADMHAEVASTAAELPGTSPAPASSAVAAKQPPVAPPPLSVSSPTPAAAISAHSPASADDSDLIEQEWVHKAKAIVERTREDPHLQNKEINKFKADYIKKRYNREIKVTEE